MGKRKAGSPDLDRWCTTVMVWWWVSYEVQFCEKGVITAAKNYQWDILTNVVGPLNQTTFQYRPWIFQQDSAPAHKGKKCNSGLKIMCPNLLVMTSPDLNPLDLKLWSVLEGMVCTRYPHNLKSLKQVLIEAVGHFPMDVVHTAINE